MIQDLIKQYYTEWESRGEWVTPGLSDCLDFMVTEVAEAIDKRLRWNQHSYVRNHKWGTDARGVAIEVFDAIMMGCIALDILGFDLEEVARDKLQRMDEARNDA